HVSTSLGRVPHRGIPSRKSDRWQRSTDYRKSSSSSDRPGSRTSMCLFTSQQPTVCSFSEARNHITHPQRSTRVFCLESRFLACCMSRVQHAQSCATPERESSSPLTARETSIALKGNSRKNSLP